MLLQLHPLPSILPTARPPAAADIAQIAISTFFSSHRHIAVNRLPRGQVCHQLLTTGAPGCCCRTAGANCCCYSCYQAQPFARRPLPLFRLLHQVHCSTLFIYSNNCSSISLAAISGNCWLPAAGCCSAADFIKLFAGLLFINRTPAIAIARHHRQAPAAAICCCFVIF